MEDRFSSLRCREVINICDGCRLGCVSDVVIDLKCGRVAALVVPVPCRLFGLLGRRDDYVIPWEQVRCSHGITSVSYTHLTLPTTERV